MKINILNIVIARMIEVLDTVGKFMNQNLTEEENKK